MLKVRVVFFALCSLWVCSAQAEEVMPPYTWSINVGVVSEYMSRGMHMNWNNPALQASVDFAHSAGWYASVWASQVNDHYYANGTVEVDLLAGKRGQWTRHWGYDFGIGAYFYPGANWSKVKLTPTSTYYPAGRYDTVEAVMGISYDWLSVRYSHTLTDYYGYDSRTLPTGLYNSGVVGGVKDGRGTRGSGYLEANANIDVGYGLTLGLHAARQHVTNSRRLDYNDYRVGVSKSLPKGWSASLNYYTTTDGEIYNDFLSAHGTGKTMDIDGSTWVLGINKAF